MSKQLKHSVLFAPGLATFSLVDFEDTEVFPKLSKVLLNEDMNQVKQYITKTYSPQGFATFISSAKVAFNLAPAEKLTPEMWKSAVKSYRTGLAGKPLTVPMEDAPAPDDSSYAAADALRGTAFIFAEALSPAFFKEATDAPDDATRIDAFLGLMEADPTQVADAISTAQEEVAAPEQETEVEVVATEEEAAAEEEVTEETSEVAQFEAKAASGLAFLQNLNASYDKLDALIAGSTENMDAAINMLRETAAENQKNLRLGFKELRDNMLKSLAGASVETQEIPAEV